MNWFVTVSSVSLCRERAFDSACTYWGSVQMPPSQGASVPDNPVITHHGREHV
jgi:hypothetical protein